MFSIDRRPKECQENDIHDVRDCKKFLKQGPDRRRGPENFGRDCKSFEDPKKRLECYDGAISGIGNYGENIEEIKARERECADKCNLEGGAWDFSGGNCKCRFFDQDYNRPEGSPGKGYTSTCDGCSRSNGGCST